MTSLVVTRQPLEIRSMNNRSERRSSKRLAASATHERDDEFEFEFVRKSKRVKTDEPEPAKKPARGRGAAKERAPKESGSAAGAAATTTTATRKTSRQKPGADASQDEPELKAATRKPRRGARLSPEKEAEESQENGASRGHGRSKGKPTRGPRRWEESPERGPPVESAKIALPMSDTPIINRNKEMRKKGNTNRRSSLGTRGRRASSLIESGQSAIPHRDVNPAEFYKHIEAEGLMEPRRMKQLLTWCGERALSEKPPHGTPNSNAILGARAIQDQLLKDFGSRTEFSNWFGRDDEPEKAPTVLQPNPRNTELDEKMASLEQKIQRLQEEKNAWLAIRKPPAEEPPLFNKDEKADRIVLPDFDLLDPDEGKIRGFLADEANSFHLVRSQTEKRLQGVQSSLEFQVDQLADNVHKLEQGVAVAGKDADRVLSLSALGLRQREAREKRRAGTDEMPIMEVLRSLGNILPEGGG